MFAPYSFCSLRPDAPATDAPAAAAPPGAAGGITDPEEVVIESK